MKLKERLEKEFGISFKDLINDLHWKQKISLNEISKRFGTSRQALKFICDKDGINLRSIKEATALTKNKGSKHWMFGRKKENDKYAKLHSERMAKNNPSNNFETRVKTASSRAEYFKRNLLPQEIMVLNILKKLKVKYKEQYPLGPYVIDFFFPSKKLCLEIDSTHKWGKERRSSANKKDLWIKEEGFLIERLNKKHISVERIRDILNAYNLISK